MKNIYQYTICALLLSGSSLQAQVMLNYEGQYLQGTTAYEYYENAEGEHIFNGKFSYTEMRNIPERGGEIELTISGNYAENKKHLAWAATFKSEAEDGTTETIIGNYLNGDKSGLWTHRIIMNGSDEEIKSVKASFIKNELRGNFVYNFNNPNAQLYTSLTVQGNFDNKGLLDGEWVLNYTDKAGTVYKDVMKYKKGVLAYRTLQNITTGDVIESLNNIALVDGFFQNIDILDSSAVVDGKKYGIRSSKLQHPLLNEVFGVWHDRSKLLINNEYNSSIPMALVARGEALKPNKALTMEIIDWKETPQGKLEYEQQMAIQDQFISKIKVADLQFEKKNYVQALPLYKEALAIKKEAYAESQIKKTEELMALEAEKKQLITLVNARYDLWTGNEKMLESEAYYGKKKHLYTACMLAFQHSKKEILAAHRDTRALIERRDIENLRIEPLRGYQMALDEAIALQDKVKELAKQEDTKELEKQLKNLEDPVAIIKILKKA